MKIQICLLASILLFSCSEKKDDSGKSDGSGKTDYSSTIIAEDPTEEDLKKELSESELEKISNVTSMSFDKTIHDYGKVIVDTDNLFGTKSSIIFGDFSLIRSSNCWVSSCPSSSSALFFRIEFM